MATQTIEERLLALESEVAKLRADANRSRRGVVGRTAPDFLDTMVGIHANSAVFEEVTREIEAERESQRQAARRIDSNDDGVAKSS